MRVRGEATLAAASRGPIDLLLLDLDLRKLSGLDVLRKLRAMSTMPVIALSSRGSQVDCIRNALPPALRAPGRAEPAAGRGRDRMSFGQAYRR